ncbi:hypothetical protein Leryth_017385 [Lithospermum erythrorhizon]|nr:hypothetical protein Leryth_017385 [Lithospermum erythrorhizon]
MPESKKKSPKSASESVVNKRITRSMSKTIPGATKSGKEPLQIPIPVQKYRMIRHTSDTMSDEDRIRINRATLEARRKARLKYVNKHFGRDKDVNERGCIRIPLPETQHLKVQTDLSDQSRLQFLNKLGVVWDTDIHRPCQGVQLITAKDVEMFEAKLAKLTKKFEAEKAKQVNKFEPEEACIPRTFAKLKNPKEKLFKYEMLQLCARLATREYNNLENTAYQFVDIEKAGYKVVGGILYYIIFQAKAEQSETFETIVFRERNGIEKGSTNHVQRVRINRPGSIWHDGTLKEDVIDRI